MLQKHSFWFSLKSPFFKHDLMKFLSCKLSGEPLDAVCRAEKLCSRHQCDNSTVSNIKFDNVDLFISLTESWNNEKQI